MKTIKNFITKIVKSMDLTSILRGLLTLNVISIIMAFIGYIMLLIR